jgi:hypothetical protein
MRAFLDYATGAHRCSSRQAYPASRATEHGEPRAGSESGQQSRGSGEPCGQAGGRSSQPGRKSGRGAECCCRPGGSAHAQRTAHRDNCDLDSCLRCERPVVDGL